MHVDMQHDMPDRDPVENIPDHPSPSFRRRIYHVLEQPAESRAGSVIHTAILLLIVANVIAVILESVEDIGAAHTHFFNVFELISVLAFLVEYIFRAWVSVEDGRYRYPVTGRLRYLLTPMAIRYKDDVPGV